MPVTRCPSKAATAWRSPRSEPHEVERRRGRPGGAVDGFTGSCLRSGSNVDSNAGSNPTIAPTATPLNPPALLQEAIGNSSAVDSFKFKFNTDTRMEGGDGQQDVSVAVNGEWAMFGGASADLEIKVPGLTMDMSMVITQSFLYLEMPGAGWTRLDADQAEEMVTSLTTISDPLEFQGGVFPVRGVPWHLYRVKSLG
jgi:hypothetical protein